MQVGKWSRFPEGGGDSRRQMRLNDWLVLFPALVSVQCGCTPVLLLGFPWNSLLSEDHYHHPPTPTLLLKPA